MYFKEVEALDKTGLSIVSHRKVNARNIVFSVDVNFLKKQVFRGNMVNLQKKTKKLLDLATSAIGDTVKGFK